MSDYFDGVTVSYRAKHNKPAPEIFEYAFTYTGNVPYYLMNDVTLEKLFSARWADLSVKAAVKNLFDEEYVSVLGRPMPGINFEIFLDIRPKWGKKKARD